MAGITVPFLPRNNEGEIPRTPPPMGGAQGSLNTNQLHQVQNLVAQTHNLLNIHAPRIQAAVPQGAPAQNNAAAAPPEQAGQKEASLRNVSNGNPLLVPAQSHPSTPKVMEGTTKVQNINSYSNSGLTKEEKASNNKSGNVSGSPSAQLAPQPRDKNASIGFRQAESAYKEEGQNIKAQENGVARNERVPSEAGDKKGNPALVKNQNAAESHLRKEVFQQTPNKMSPVASFQTNGQAGNTAQTKPALQEGAVLKSPTIPLAQNSRPQEGRPASSLPPQNQEAKPLKNSPSQQSTILQNTGFEQRQGIKNGQGDIPKIPLSQMGVSLAPQGNPKGIPTAQTLSTAQNKGTESMQGSKNLVMSEGLQNNKIMEQKPGNAPVLRGQEMVGILREGPVVQEKDFNGQLALLNSRHKKVEKTSSDTSEEDSEEENSEKEEKED